MLRYLMILTLIINYFNLAFGIEKKEIKVSGGVLDISLYQHKIIVSTEKGSVEEIDLKSGKLINKIILPKFKDFMGEFQLPKVFSVDISPDGNVLAIITEATGGNRELYIYTEKKLNKLISTEEGLQLTKVRFWNNDLLLMATKGGGIFLYDLKNKRYLYKTQITNYSYGDLDICDDKSKAVLGDEGGTVFLFDIKSGRILKKFDKVNVDQIYRVDCKAGKIVTGGRDRRVGYYDINSGYFKKVEADFVVFSVALSLDGKKVAFQLNEEDDIGIYDFSVNSIIERLKGHKSTIGILEFISENTLVSGSDDGKLILWRLK